MQSAPDATAGTSPASALPPPVVTFRVLLFSVLALAAGCGTAIWLNQVRFERFPGYLQARMQTLTADRDARIAQILVGPGTVVVPGQPIVVLQDQELEERLRTRKQEIESLEIELTRTRAALDVQIEIQQRDIRDRIFETRLRSAQLQRQRAEFPLEVPAPTKVVEQWTHSNPVVVLPGKPLPIFNANDRVVTALAEEPASISRIVPAPMTNPEMELCTERIAELERLSQDLPQKIGRSMGVDLAQTRVDHARAALATLEQQQKELTLVAQSAGMIGVFHRQVGDRVAAHEPIVQLLDEEQPYLMLQIPSPRISDFQPGTIVDLKFPGGETGKGRVEAIPPQTSDIPDEPGSHRETVITAHIDPVGKLWPTIPFGSVVEVCRKR